MLSKLRNIKWPGNSKAEGTGTAADAVQATDKKGNVSTKPASTEKQPASSDTNLEAELASSSEKIRARACAQIKDSALLLPVALNDQSENVQLIAARQYAKVLPANETAQQTLLEFAADPEKRHLARLITAHNNDGSLRSFGVSQFTADTDLFHIATETRFHDTRQTVTSSLKSLDLVDKCYRAIKSKDKIVARELKQRINEHQAGNELLVQQEQETDKIIDEMTKLAHGAWTPTYPNRYELFAKRWQSIDFAIPDDKRGQFETLNTIAADKVAGHATERQALDDQVSIIKELKESLSTLMSTELPQLSDTVEQINNTAKTLQDRWQTLPSDTSAESTLDQDYKRLSLAVSSQLKNATATLRSRQEIDNEQQADTKLLEKQLGQLQDIKTRLAQSGSEPAYAQALPAIMESLQHSITRNKKQALELKTTINKQFGSLNSAISANRWGPARSIHERLSKKINRLGRSEQQHFAEKLERLEKKLNDLGDWKQFATEPKLEALCEQMEKVPALGLAPKDQADRIKDLQQQWKAMGASPGQEAHWPRFKKAADIAFEPCAQYFQARRNEKDAKLKHRTEICDMLQAYLDKSDWQNPDWKLVEKTIRTAKNEWRNARVFDRKAGAELETRFTKVLADIDQKLQPAYDAGSAEKTDLIAKVTALSEGEINQHCMNQVKKLQSMWRRTGVSRRKDDQKLWAEFNDACSKIYQTHRGHQREQYAASMEHVTRARQIITELKNVGKNNVIPDEKQLQQLQDEFNSLAEFPEKEQKYLLRDFTRALDSVENHRVKMNESAQQNELHRLSQNADICRELEKLAGQPSDSLQVTIDSLNADWSEGEKTDNPRWKKAMQLRRDTILAHLSAGTLPDFEHNTQERRLLCIETEILNDRETPESDKQLRMQYQLNKLQQGLTSANAASPNEQRVDLKIRWLTMFPADPVNQDSLHQRFNSAIGG